MIRCMHFLVQGLRCDWTTCGIYENRIDFHEKFLTCWVSEVNCGRKNTSTRAATSQLAGEVRSAGDSEHQSKALGCGGWAKRVQHGAASRTNSCQIGCWYLFLYCFIFQSGRMRTWVTWACFAGWTYRHPWFFRVDSDWRHWPERR